jgi:hypothetical protein
MEGDTVTTPAEACPRLVPVMADRLWLYPTAVYCRRADGRVRVPGASTLDCVCLTAAHFVCPGYLEGLGQPPRMAGLA